MIWTSPLSLWLRDVARRLGVNRVLGAWVHRRGYEERFGSTLLATVRPGDVVWDVGANVGLYSEQFLAAAGSSGKVIAFEPAGECYDQLVRRFADTATFEAVNVAMGASDGKALMEFSGTGLSPTNRVVADSETSNAGQNTRTVSLRSAQSICSQYPDWFPNVVKVDVEGHEGAVFDGFADLLADKRLRAIGVEVHFGLLHSRGENGTPSRIERSLQASGFGIKWTDPSHLIAIKRA